MKEFINVKMDKELFEILEFWKKERIHDKENQRTAGTAFPYFIVEDSRYVDCLPEEADVSYITPIEQLGYTIDEIRKGEFKKDFDISEELQEELDSCLNLEEMKDVLDNSNVPELVGCYITYLALFWEEKSIFLTRKEAEEYMRYQSHNLTDRARIYVKSPGYDNRGKFPKFLDLLTEEDVIESNVEM